MAIATNSTVASAIRPHVATPDEHRLVLAYLAQHSDLLEPTLPVPRGAVRWLLTPISSAVLSILECFGAEAEDSEDSHDAEHERDTWTHWIPDWEPCRFIPSESTEAGR